MTFWPAMITINNSHDNKHLTKSQPELSFIIPVYTWSTGAGRPFVININHLFHSCSLQLSSISCIIFVWMCDTVFYLALPWLPNNMSTKCQWINKVVHRLVSRRQHHTVQHQYSAKQVRISNRAQKHNIVTSYLASKLHYNQ